MVIYERSAKQKKYCNSSIQGINSRSSYNKYYRGLLMFSQFSQCEKLLLPLDNMSLVRVDSDMIV